MNRFNIGKRIGLYREKLHMSTQQLANMIGRSQATISRIENGKQGLTPELLTQIAKVLRVHPFALLSDKPLRHSVLVPLPGEGGFAPSLLSNALRAGRLLANLNGNDAAADLGIPLSELRTIEMGLSSPNDELLAKMATLYGLPSDEMQVITEIDSRLLDLSRRLASFQYVLSKIKEIINNMVHGNEADAIEKIKAALLLPDSDNLMAVEENHAIELGLPDKRSSQRFFAALKNPAFVNQFTQLVNSFDTGQD